ncbi:MAG TPA: hypothetical protein VN831_11635, partial [Bradyrhizobium sp.]|nr:hypothetical protein [Bradyrhizobium sp.]
RITLNPSSLFRGATGPTSPENALVYWQAASPDYVTASTELPLTMAAYVRGLLLAIRTVSPATHAGS